MDDAFEGIKEKREARVLDPCCGAGIFLVLAFRKLFSARWEHDGKRPDTQAIQSILYHQICGFDISESALRLAALSLYITAIELNGTPRPPESLKFPKPLRDVVLYNHRRSEELNIKGFVMGSLHSDISDGFENRFDMIVGNPPWSRLRGDDEETKRRYTSHNVEFTELIRRILKDRGLADLSRTYCNPDNNPDLAFVWKSTQWAKPDGIIAMVLPGRIILKQTGAGIQGFHAILQGIEVTGILNGSNLADSFVWPGMNQPFMLFFARNRRPADTHHFYFVTPHFERFLNDKGRLRIDYQSAQPVAALDVEKDSQLLKTLAVGTVLDIEVVRKLDELGWPTVQSYWISRGMYTGRGYDLSPKQHQANASFMHDLPDFARPPDDSFTVDISSLDKFKRVTAHMPRRIELYTPPLLIVPESPGSSLVSPKSWITREPTVFNKSYYGFSSYGRVEAETTIAFLHLVTHSELFRYHVLVTSSRMGAERRTFLKENLENFPFPLIDKLSQEQKERARTLSDQPETAFDKPWKNINDFIFELYKLDECDRQVIRDTLEVASPFKKSRDRANALPLMDERNKFYTEVKRLLTPSFTVTNETVTVDEFGLKERNIRSPWYFFIVSTSSSASNISNSDQRKLISQVTLEANKTGCSRVVVHDNACLLVGIIGQYRYWTLSRARLCALDILRCHLDIFPMGKR